MGFPTLIVALVRLLGCLEFLVPWDRRPLAEPVVDAEPTPATNTAPLTVILPRIRDQCGYHR